MSDLCPSSTKGTVKAIADRVNELLSSAVGFSEYYCIVDGDADVDGVEFGGRRIYTLPAYHVENYLLDEALILRATRTLLRERTPYANVGEIAEALGRLVMSDSHMNSVARSLFNAKLRGFSKRATEELRTRKKVSAMEVDFGDVRREAEAYLRAALDEASWKRKAIGRVLLRAYCGEIRVKYLQFRNLLLDSASDAPADLQGIMQQIGIRKKQLVERPPEEQRQEQAADSRPVLSAAEGVMIIPKEFKEEGELRIGSLQLGDYTIILDYEHERIEGPEGPERSDIWKRFLRLMRTERGRALWNSQLGVEADEFRDAKRAELWELLGLPTE
jgi:hypothetical protein